MLFPKVAPFHWLRGLSDAEGKSQDVAGFDENLMRGDCEPTATKTPLPNARALVVKPVLTPLVQVIPSGEVITAPVEPAATATKVSFPYTTDVHVWALAAARGVQVTPSVDVITCSLPDTTVEETATKVPFPNATSDQPISDGLDWEAHERPAAFAGVAPSDKPAARSALARIVEADVRNENNAMKRPPENLPNTPVGQNQNGV
jgi:hypothetical protein